MSHASQPYEFGCIFYVTSFSQRLQTFFITVTFFTFFNVLMFFKHFYFNVFTSVIKENIKK